MQTQHNATLLGATCCHRVSKLGVVGLSLKMIKFEPTIPNMSQHIATRWQNARNMLHPTVLRYVVLTCCDRQVGRGLKPRPRYAGEMSVAASN